MADPKQAPDNYDPMTEHQTYARTGKVDFNQNFGVKPHDHKNRPHSEPMLHRKPALKDGARGAGKVDGYHPAPDHGPFE